MGDDDDVLLRPAVEGADAGAAAGEEGRFEGEVLGAGGGELVWVDGVDGGEVDHGVFFGEFGDGAPDVAGLGGGFCTKDSFLAVSLGVSAGEAGLSAESDQHWRIG